MYFLIIKWVPHFHIKTKRAQRGCLLLSPKFWGLQQVKIKQQTLGNRTNDRSSFFRGKEQTLAEGLRCKTEQEIKNRAWLERYMITGRRRTAHLFAGQSKLLSAPRGKEELALNWSTWWPLKHTHTPRATACFLLLFSSKAALSELPLPGCLCTHLPTSNYTPLLSPPCCWSRVAMAITTIQGSADEAGGGDCLQLLKGVNLFFFPKNYSEFWCLEQG